MFSLFTRDRGARPRSVRPVPHARRFQPGLEALEGRDCPSAFGVQPSQQLWQLLNTAPVMPAAQLGTYKTAYSAPINGGGGSGGGSQGSTAPTISLSVTYNGKTNVTLSGTVTDLYASPAGLTVTISGVVNGSAVTDSNGNFTLTTNASALGVVNASTIDSRGVGSNVASVTLQANPPVISNFAAVGGANQMYTFSGTVTDQTPAGLVIAFGGIPSLANKTTTVNADGSFSLTVQLQCDGTDNGFASAQTTNWWGLQSNVATYYVDVTG
jgi:hypothetical protein